MIIMWHILVGLLSIILFGAGELWMLVSITHGSAKQTAIGCAVFIAGLFLFYGTLVNYFGAR